MASTSYDNNIRVVTLSGYSFGFDSRTVWSSVSRTNNTITINGLRSQVRINSGSGGAWFSGWTVEAHVDAPSGTRRRNVSLGSGTFYRGSEYLGSSGNYSMTVSSTATAVSTRSAVTVGGGANFTGVQSISIPALGVPTGTTTIQSGTTTSSIPVRANVTSWGANATSGSVRCYIADNSSFSGQTYKSTTDNELETFTGLTSNNRYWFRGWAENGGDRAAYHSSTNGYTLPLAPTVSSATPTATTIDLVTSQNVGGGDLTITKKYRYRVVAGTWSDWTTYATDELSISGLLPSTEYEYQLSATTTAGTTEGSTATTTTLPAAKLVMPGGEVVNAIPRVIPPEGGASMVKVRII